MQHPIDTMMQTTMEHIRSMVDVNTVVGSPVTGTHNTTIIPISKVSFGFIAGGGEYTAEEQRSRAMAAAESYPFAGGTGAGVSVQPVGFLVVDDDTVRMLPAQTNGAMERVVELLPQLLEDLSQNGESNGRTKAKKVIRTVVETMDPPAEEGGEG